MRKRNSIRDSFVFDENHHLRIDKSRIFTPSEIHRHALCLRLLDVIKDSVATFKPSDSLAHIPSLATISGTSHDNLYDFFIPTDENVPITTGSTTKRPSIGLAQGIAFPKALERAQTEPFSPQSPFSSLTAPVEIDLVISGGGIKGYFMTGASHILKHELRKQNIRIRRISGTSAGAWCGMFMLCDFSTSDWLETYYLTKDRINKYMHEAYDVRSLCFFCKVVITVSCSVS
jgi:hypothetical protein